MAKKSFKNLDELELYLQKNIMQILSKDASIERILAENMAAMVFKYVYDAYDPIEYERREDDGGLADTRNMFITNWGVRDGSVFLTFENLTQGQTNQSPIYGHSQDSLEGKYIGDTIEFGIKDNWYDSTGEWAKPRPFAEETVNAINANPTELLNALKTALIKKGFLVK
jgi:hypothetical protein